MKFIKHSKFKNKNSKSNYTCYLIDNNKHLKGFNKILENVICKYKFI